MTSQNGKDYNFNKQFINEFRKNICNKCMHKDKNVKCAQLDIYQPPPHFMQMYWYCKNYKNKYRQQEL